MGWYLLIGAVFTAWTLLRVLAGERQRRLNEIQAKQKALALAAAPKEPEIPIVR